MSAATSTEAVTSSKVTKYILVSGGVISGIGKGVITSSIGTLLKAVGLQVTAIKIDPYLNIDAGTFSPYEHGERALACVKCQYFNYCLVIFYRTSIWIE